MILKVKNIGLYINKIGLKATLFYFIKRLYFKKDQIISVQLPGETRKVFLRNKTFDTHIFFQIFIREELKFAQQRGIVLNTIIDAGANIGLATIYLKKIFPNAFIVSIEPSLQNFNLLLKNIEGYKKITAVNAALMGENKQVWISNPQADYASFQFGERCTGGQGIVAFSLAQVIQDSGFKKIDFVKMDIEGSEKEVFEQLDANTLEKVQSFAIELHKSIHPEIEAIITGKLFKFKSLLTDGEYSYFEKI